jgi:hypothetical protein
LHSSLKDYGMALLYDHLLLLKLPLAFVRQQLELKAKATGTHGSGDEPAIAGSQLVLSLKRQTRLTVLEPGLGTRLFSIRSGLGIVPTPVPKDDLPEEHVEVWSAAAASSSSPAVTWLGNNLHLAGDVLSPSPSSDASDAPAHDHEQTNHGSLKDLKTSTASHVASASVPRLLSVRVDVTSGQAELIYRDMNDGRITSSLLTDLLEASSTSTMSQYRIIRLIGDYYYGSTTIIEAATPTQLPVGSIALLQSSQLSALHMRLFVEQRLESLVLRTDNHGGQADDNGNDDDIAPFTEMVATVPSTIPTSAASVSIIWLGNAVAADIRQSNDSDREGRLITISAGCRSHGIPSATGRFYIPITSTSDKKSASVSSSDTAIVQRNEGGTFSVYYKSHYWPIGSSAIMPSKLPLLLLSPSHESSLLLSEATASSTASSSSLPTDVSGVHIHMDGGSNGSSGNAAAENKALSTYSGAITYDLHASGADVLASKTKWSYIMVCQCSSCVVGRASLPLQWNELLAARFDISREEYNTMTTSHGPLFPAAATAH